MSHLSLQEAISFANLAAAETQANGDRCAIERSSAADYDLDFGTTIGAPLIMAAGMRSALQKKPIVIVDLMAGTEAIRSLAAHVSNYYDADVSGIAVSLKDHRNAEEKRFDEAHAIRHILGDLSLSATWDALEQALGETKPDIIMERGANAVECLPRHPEYYRQTLGRMWRMLNPDRGFLAVQTPYEDTLTGMGLPPLGEIVEAWQQQGVTARLGCRLEQYEPQLRPSLYLEKTPGAPAVLPDVTGSGA